jgi:hypothetical protein
MSRSGILVGTSEKKRGKRQNKTTSQVYSRYGHHNEQKSRCGTRKLAQE